MKKKIIPVLIAAVLIILIVGISLGKELYEKYSYSKEQMDLNEYFALTTEDEVALILNGERQAVYGLMNQGSCYLDLDTVHTYLNDRFYVDYNEGLLLYCLPDSIESLTLGEQEEDGTVPAYLDGETVYLSLECIQRYTNFAFSVYEDPDRAVLTTAWGEAYQIAELKKSTALRYQGGVKSSILTQLEAGDTVEVLETFENWSEVRTADGFTGYVENRFLINQQEATDEDPLLYEEPEYPSLTREDRICLGWHQVISAAANDTLDEMLDGVYGMNVISPTWFFLCDNEGNFESIGTTEYVEKAHLYGLEVWVLLDNFTYEVDTQEILSYTSKRATLIEGLVSETLALGADGINVDLEQVPTEAGEDYIEFIRELGIACHQNDLVLSVDNYVPKDYNAHYHWEEQGVFADYVIIMGYDEHYAGSSEAGSVASIDFVEEGISTMVQYVSADKVINAVPFYTRIWETDSEGLSSQAVGMQTVQDFLTLHGAEVLWDEETCQNYAEFQEGDSFYQVWIEDEQSLQAKTGIMEKYGVGGVAVWKLGYEKGYSQVWSILAEYVD